VAWGYALAGRNLPTIDNPAYVYEVEIDENDGLGTRLLDPVQAIAAGLGSPYETRTYHHDGDNSFLLGLVDPVNHRAILRQDVRFPPPGEGTDRSPLLHIELEALVRALRDSEILAFGAVAASQIRRRIEVSYAGHLQFRDVVLFETPRLPFAIVYYTEGGVAQKEGLRLDLDKQVFLDHFTDARSEELASAAAPKIITFLGTRGEAASAAHAY
jgi:hypothetical protein